MLLPGVCISHATRLANEVARAVAQQRPGKFVGLYAYNEHNEPPSFDLEPNVYVQLTAGFIRGRYSFDELVELWPQRCKSLGFYEYFSVWLWDFDRLPGGRAGPDGTKLKQVETSGAFVKIAVPEGADGSVWHFTRMQLGHLWFFNVPNYLAASPAALLVPEELAQRDGLSPLGRD